MHRTILFYYSVSLFQVVLCAKPAIGEWAGALQEHGRQVVRTGKGGFALRERGWWQRASLATRPLKADVVCWVHQVLPMSPQTNNRKGPVTRAALLFLGWIK